MADVTANRISQAADRLASLYDAPFGGRTMGRYRISMKHMRMLLDCARVYPDQLAQLSRCLYERGYVLIDLESYFVVLKQRTFVGYRRTNEDCVRLRGARADAA